MARVRIVARWYWQCIPHDVGLCGEEHTMARGTSEHCLKSSGFMIIYYCTLQRGKTRQAVLAGMRKVTAHVMVKAQNVAFTMLSTK